MRRASTDTNDLPGQDSFLDIVANIVGILILLVMVVGVRAAKAPSTPTADAKADASDRATPEALSAAEEIRRTVEEDVQRLRSVYRENLLRDAERLQLATMVAALRDELETQRSQLDQQQQQDFDLTRQLNEARRELEDLMSQQVSAQAAADDGPQKVDNLPTPLAKTVSGNEVHLRMSRGRVAIVPFDELRDEFEQHARRNVWRLENSSEYVDTIGPIAGFRMRYRLAKIVQMRRGPQGELYRQMTHVPTYIEFLPTSTELGEPVSVALEPHSELMEYLSDRSPKSTVITAWTYPDSFDEFRTLKKALFQQGFAVAGRPKPHGDPIAASPHGSRSAAQ